MTRRAWTALVVVILAAGLSAWAGHWRRERAAAGCAFDGLPIETSLRVRATPQAGEERVFCSLRCAECWLAAAGEHGAAVYVTDEATGDELSAEDAYYVRSRIVSHAMSGERRHVFRSLQDAQRHAESYQGRVLVGKLRPFSAIPLTD